MEPDKDQVRFLVPSQPLPSASRGHTCGMDNAKLYRDLVLVERALAALREAEVYCPGDPEIVSEELAFERLRVGFSSACVRVRGS